MSTEVSATSRSHNSPDLGGTHHSRPQYPSGEHAIGIDQHAYGSASAEEQIRFLRKQLDKAESAIKTEAQAARHGHLGKSGPVGLAGFAATTFTLAVYLTGMVPYSVKLADMGSALMYGGIVQGIAGIFALIEGNTFAGTAFLSYGAVNSSWFFKQIFYVPGPGATTQDVKAGSGIYWLSFAIFSFYMCLGAMRTNIALFGVIFTLAWTYLMAGVADFIDHTHSAATISRYAAGGFGISTAAIAWYLSMAIIVNSSWGADLVPIGVIGPLSESSNVPSWMKNRIYKSQEETADNSGKDTIDRK